MAIRAKSCCLCVELQTSVMILGILGILGHGYQAYAAFSSFQQYSYYGAMFPDSGLGTYAALYILLLLLNVVGLFFSGIGISAGYKEDQKQARLFAAWLWANLILTVISAVITIVVISVLASAFSGLGQNDVISSLIMITVAIYAAVFLIMFHFAVVATSYQKQLEQKASESAPQPAMIGVVVASPNVVPGQGDMKGGQQIVYVQAQPALGGQPMVAAQAPPVYSPGYPPPGVVHATAPAGP